MGKELPYILQFYDKELSMLEAKRRGLDKNYAENLKEQDNYSLYLSLDAKKESVIAQSEIIKELAKKESFVIVGRASDYVLREQKNVLKVFLYAPMEYKIKNIMNIYQDDYKEAKRRIVASDKARSAYYEVVSNQKWGDKENYNLCLDCSLGSEVIIEIIAKAISNER